MLHAMIMAGGGGTRFWPRSRASRPKQFLTFSGDRSLLQATLDRIEAQAPRERTWVITGASHRDEAISQLPELMENHIVGEPTGRDTAACIALGAALIARDDPNAVMIAMPADHAIEPVQEFRRAVHAAEQLAEEHPAALITFGIPPSYPATGYGYIHRGQPAAQRQGTAAYSVKQFKEKPPFDVAERYVASGEYYWNSGIFVWKVSAILDELKRQKPQLLEGISRIADAWGTPAQDEVFRASTNEPRRSASTSPSWSMPHRCWSCRRPINGTTSAAGWPWSAAMRRMPPETRFRRCILASKHPNASLRPIRNA